MSDRPLSTLKQVHLATEEREVLAACFFSRVRFLLFCLTINHPLRLIESTKTLFSDNVLKELISSAFVCRSSKKNFKERTSEIQIPIGCQLCRNKQDREIYRREIQRSHSVLLAYDSVPCPCSNIDTLL